MKKPRIFMLAAVCVLAAFSLFAEDVAAVKIYYGSDVIKTLEGKSGDAFDLKFNTSAYNGVSGTVLTDRKTGEVLSSPIIVLGQSGDLDLTVKANLVFDDLVVEAVAGESFVVPFAEAPENCSVLGWEAEDGTFLREGQVVFYNAGFPASFKSVVREDNFLTVEIVGERNIKAGEKVRFNTVIKNLTEDRTANNIKVKAIANAAAIEEYGIYSTDVKMLSAGSKTTMYWESSKYSFTVKPDVKPGTNFIIRFLVEYDEGEPIERAAIFTVI